MRVIFTPRRCPSSAEMGKSLGIKKSTTRVFVSFGRMWIIRGPGSVIFQMRLLYRCFRVSGPRWHSQENENIFDAFKCVLKDRYRDRMKGIRRQSANMARNDGKPLPPKFCSYYDGMHNYRHERVPETMWQRLCDHWSTEKWQKNSKIAQQNRNTADSSGSTTRHIAGSIGFDQHRRKLEQLMGKPPTQYDVFVKTHGTAESKKKYFEGHHENLEYCSQTAKEAQEAYLQGLVNKFGEDPSNRKDDVGVWEESQLRRKGKKKGAIYGIGASDIYFLVLGTPSSQSTQSTQSDSMQQEVHRLRAQVSVMEQQQQQMMKEQMEMVMRMINMSGNQPRGPPDNPPEDN
ncbi:unnamed protein product [Lactuca virosa]|uniref:Transposase, Ptta/En/Spm, plant n=1 Tax=Lactuca virosa TaxID=75947 RepID=A0AAU9PML1_9ASTR|nr:unnamed protein product [Lactuca virosa]